MIPHLASSSINLPERCQLYCMPDMNWPKDAVQFAERDGKTPGIVVLGHERHFELVPVARRQIGAYGTVIIDPCHALLVAQRLFRFCIAGKRHDFHAIAFFHDLVVERALLATDFPCPSGLPIR